MDPAIHLTNVTNESNVLQCSCGKKIHVMQKHSIKEERECLVPTQIYIKTEPQDYETEFVGVAGTSYETCSNFDADTDVPIVKVECKNFQNDCLADPLDVSGTIKDEGIQEHTTFEPKVKQECKIEECSQTNDGSAISDVIGRINRYTCHMCHNEFVHKSDLDRHLSTHNDERPFSCHICNKSFAQKAYLKSHLVTHTDIRPWVCDICNNTYRKKAFLDKHKTSHSDLKPYSCIECGKSFKHPRNLNIHIKIHQVEKKYKCDICNKGFNRKCRYTLHQSRHTKKTPYSCDICNLSFNAKSYLKVHKRIHTGEKPFSCEICEKSFRRISEFNKHNKKHHNVN